MPPSQAAVHRRRRQPAVAPAVLAGLRRAGGDARHRGVLQDEIGCTEALPDRSSFPGFRTELESYPVLAVRCVWFGEPLGVFTVSGPALSPAEAGRLAQDITAVAPRHVRCAAGP